MPVQAERRLWYKLPLVSQANRRSSGNPKFGDQNPRKMYFGIS